MEQNIEQLKKLAKVFNTDNVITSAEIEQVLTGIVSIMASFRKENIQLTEENKQICNDLMSEIQSQYKKTLENINNKETSLSDSINTEISKLQAKFNEEIKKAQDLINELKSIEVKDGEDADEEIIVSKVLEQIKLPEYKETVLDTAEQIADKLETLKDDKRLDASAIKNLPEFIDSRPNGGGWRNLFQLHDVNINNPTNAQVLKYDSTAKQWKNDTDTAGSGTVTSVSVVTANGFSGAVATATTTPAITIDVSGLDATKIADGSVTNTEFQYINTLTSNAQTQLNGKQSTLQYYKEPSAAPAVAPIASGTAAIAIGDTANATGDNQLSFGFQAGKDTTLANNSVFIGTGAGLNSTNAYSSNFIGSNAGANSTGHDSNFFGTSAGQGATSAYGSNFIGYEAGKNASGAYYANFIGGNAGSGATSALSSSFMGYNAGLSASAADHSIFIGDNAGSGATNASYTIAIGNSAGLNDTVNNSGGTQSILIGTLTSTGGFGDSIAIGTYATNTKSNQLVIGENVGAGFGGEISEIAWRGILRSSDMHNNAAGQGTAAEQDVRSGTYTPTLTAVTNVNATTARKCQWLRVGNVVTVSGQMDIDPAGTGITVVGISLPVASSFGTAYECGGAGHTPAVAGHGSSIYADAANDRAELSYIESVGTTDVMTFTFTYEVI